ncbi:tRNA 2-selenouridine(34) synthase MnmH [Candidatus Woesearchaeota archaeon]|nr:tRNA 2-selenouridine(34) synthase MnmH [Candidatus Woesearchaeota archaeon]
MTKQEFPIKIEPADALLMPKALFIDMRSPMEFGHSTIPGAINMPMFTDEERATVGLTYKQKGQKEAVLIGMDYFAPKLPDYFRQIHELNKKNRLIIFCARGGMRSGSMAELCNSTGFRVHQLSGGYKAYRKHINRYLHDWSTKKPIFVLDGLTGTGKTRILQDLKNSLDLEGLAQHRSSLLGAIGLKPVTQKMFDSRLYDRLIELEDADYIIIEGESRKVGFVQMPDSLYKTILKGIHINVTASMDTRIKFLVEDYTQVKPKEIADRVALLTKKLSKQDIKEINAHIMKKDYKTAFPMILEKYYDPLYKHTVDRKEYSFSVEHENTDKAIKSIVSFIRKHMK